jgi:hypothetical protein
MPGMKKSTIKLALKKKIDNWLSTVTDQTLIENIKKDVIVSGGAIASMLSEEKVNDYDLYFRTVETAKAVAEYYVSVFNSTNEIKTKNFILNSCKPEVKLKPIKNIKGEVEDRIVIYMKSSGVAGEGQSEYSYFENEEEVEADTFLDSIVSDNPIEVAEELLEETKSKGNSKYRPIFFSDNAITLSDKVQLIIRFYGEPNKILDNYDYAHSMCYYDYYPDNLVLHSEALEAILSKTLIYKGSLYPIASIFRTRKFISRGWRITAGQMLKILWQIKDIDLNNSDVLREQLIGVDQAYMSQLLSVLGDNKSTRIDSTYLAKLIDEIFE